MGSGLITVFLPIALAIIMAGLGLELTINDFKRVRQHPKAVFIALFCQLVILVGIAFIICKVLALPPMLAVGLMLLSASPGGPTANLFSYLYKGDIALNITLTAINSVIAAFTLPLIVNFAIQHFMENGQNVGLQFSKIIQVFLIILVPVGIGMLVRHFAPHTAENSINLCVSLLSFSRIDHHISNCTRLSKSDDVYWANWIGNFAVLRM